MLCAGEQYSFEWTRRRRGVRRLRSGLAIVALAVLCSGCSLRWWADHRGVLIGAAADASHLSDDPTYPRVLADEFNALTPENEMKWDTIHPRQDTYNFGPGDALVAFALAHHMAVRGHTLVWHNQNPAWLLTGWFTPAQLQTILAGHIATVVGHYANKVVQWDVVNEAFNDDGTLRSDIWSNGLGPSYIDQAFIAARQADPRARLFYNDYNTEYPGPKADAVFNMVASMKARGVPIDGVGFQMHATETFPTARQLASQMARYAAIGVQAAVTEMDVRLLLPPRATDLRTQAADYHDAMTACLEARNCTTFVTWGFTDKYSWIPTFFPGYGAALIFDQNYQHKPAYDALNHALANN
jgi:endo-1,4-beta-xylanase